MDVTLSDDSSPSSRDAHGVGGSSGSASKNLNKNITIDLPPKETESDSEGIFHICIIFSIYIFHPNTVKVRWSWAIFNFFVYGEISFT